MKNLSKLTKKDMQFLDTQWKKQFKPLTQDNKFAIMTSKFWKGKYKQKREDKNRKDKPVEKIKTKANKANQELQRFAAFLAIVVMFAYFGFDYFNGDSIGTALSTVAGMVAVSKLRI